MILLIALFIGLVAGFMWARWQGHTYQPPDLRYLWLAFAAFLPQFLVVYLPSFRGRLPDTLVALCLTTSQLLFLTFVWLNRRAAGMIILLIGLLLNLAVMAANNGFMPIAPQTAGRLVSPEVLANVQPGSRFGIKDILLHPQDTRFEWLADRFLPPAWFPYQAAFSLGDVFIAIGAFWLLARGPHSISHTNKKVPT